MTVIICKLASCRGNRGNKFKLMKHLCVLQLLLVMGIYNCYRKGIMQDIVKYADFTNEKFLEIHTRMQKAVDTIKPVEEYKDFIGKHR